MSEKFKIKYNEISEEKILFTLKKYGVVVIDEYYKNLKLEALKKLFFEIINDKQIIPNAGYKAGILKAQVPPFENSLIYDEFIHENSLLNKIAKSYLMDEESSCNNIFYHVDNDKKNVSIQPWHFDNIQSLKFFIYLKDTNEENGAFKYSYGSHIEGNARAQMHLMNGGQITNIPNTKKDEYIINGVSIEAPAGSLIIFDTDGYHGGNNKVTKGERHVIRVHFSKSNFYTYKPGIRFKQYWQYRGGLLMNKIFGDVKRSNRYEDIFSKGIDY